MRRNTIPDGTMPHRILRYPIRLHRTPLDSTGLRLGAARPSWTTCPEIILKPQQKAILLDWIQMMYQLMYILNQDIHNDTILNNVHTPALVYFY